MSHKKVIGPLFGFLALIIGFVSVASWFLGARLAFWILLLLCAATFAVFAGAHFKEFVNFFVSRQLRYGINVALSILGVIGIAVFVNVIIAQRFDKRVDLTELKRHTLSEQTKQILRNLDKNVQVTAFFSNNDPYLVESAKELLALYQRETDLLTVSFKNPYIDIALATKYNITISGTTIFESAERQEKVTTVDEQKFTGALLKLSQNKIKKVYFIVGHGEREIDDLGPTGYSGVKTVLENQHYAAFPLSLLTQPTIPVDCELLVIAGPKTALEPEEIRMVQKYLAQNGKLLLLLDPSPSAVDVNSRLVQLMKRWGVTIGNDLVFDRAPSRFAILMGPSAPVPDFEFHEITRFMPQARLPFPYTRSITPMTNIKANLSVKSLAKTTVEKGVSWGETAREADGTFSGNGYTPGVDTPAPVSLAVAVEKKTDRNTTPTDRQGDKDGTTTEDQQTRIVVFGGSQFATNAFSNVGLNYNLLLSTINWLTTEEDLIAIPQVDSQQQALRQMTGQDARLVQLASIFLIPFIVFTAGLIVWWQRREGGSA